MGGTQIFLDGGGQPLMGGLPLDGGGPPPSHPLVGTPAFFKTLPSLWIQLKVNINDNTKDIIKDNIKDNINTKETFLRTSLFKYFIYLY